VKWGVSNKDAWFKTLISGAAIFGFALVLLLLWAIIFTDMCASVSCEGCFKVKSLDKVEASPIEYTDTNTEAEMTPYV